MSYEINVAKPNGKNWNGTDTQYVHYFRVVTDYGNYKRVYADLVKAFPDCKIDIYLIQKTSKLINEEV